MYLHYLLNYFIKWSHTLSWCCEVVCQENTHNHILTPSPQFHTVTQGKMDSCCLHEIPALPTACEHRSWDASDPTTFSHQWLQVIMCIVYKRKQCDRQVQVNDKEHGPQILHVWWTRVHCIITILFLAKKNVISLSLFLLMVCFKVFLCATVVVSCYWPCKLWEKSQQNILRAEMLRFPPTWRSQQLSLGKSL